MSRWLTVPDVARQLGFTPKTVRVWCARGVFPGAAKWPDNRPTSEWRIPKADVEAMKRRQTGPRAVPNDRLDELMDAAMGAAGRKLQ